MTPERHQRYFVVFFANFEHIQQIIDCQIRRVVIRNIATKKIL